MSVVSAGNVRANSGVYVDDLWKIDSLYRRAARGRPSESGIVFPSTNCASQTEPCPLLRSVLGSGGCQRGVSNRARVFDLTLFRTI